ncbi:MAG: hypothetical protein AB7T49_08895 [Oligoflexales bacterium]
MRRIFCAALIVLVTISCRSRLTSDPYAGNDYGRGGDVVDCPNGQHYPEPGSGPLPNHRNIVALEIHQDIMQNVDTRNDFGPANQDYIKTALNVVDRLAKVDPVRHARLKEWILEFEKEMVTKKKISDYPDTGSIEIAEDCTKVQVVERRKPIVGDDDLIAEDLKKRYWIFEKYWNAIDDNNKATIVLHEVIYRDAPENGHETSERTRLFVRKLLKDGFKNLNQRQYFDFLNVTLDFPGYIEVLGIPVLGTSLVVENGKTTKGTIMPQHEWKDSNGNPQKEWRDAQKNIYSFKSEIDDTLARVEINEKRVAVIGKFNVWQDHDHKVVGDSLHFVRVSENVTFQKGRNDRFFDHKFVFEAASSPFGSARGQLIGAYVLDALENEGQFPEAWLRIETKNGEKESSWGAFGFETDIKGRVASLSQVLGKGQKMLDGRIYAEDEPPPGREWDGWALSAFRDHIDLHDTGIPKEFVCERTHSYIGQTPQTPLPLKNRSGKEYFPRSNELLKFDRDGYIIIQN